MAYTVDGHQCGKKMKRSVQPVERRKAISGRLPPTMMPHTLVEWICPNGHFRELTHAKSRSFE